MKPMYISDYRQTFVWLWVAMMSLATIQRSAEAQPPIVIAHRGASGYLPEHTQEAVVLAHAQGADYIEQDVVLSKDHIPFVLHDIHLERVSDVARKFPGRARSDGRYYALDFTAEELRQLNVTERLKSAQGSAVYPSRFPAREGRFTIPTLADELDLIQGLNRSSGREVGIYVEIKAPAWHREQGADVTTETLKVLEEYGYMSRDSAAYLQCFDWEETLRIRRELKSELRLVQLIGDNSWGEAKVDYDFLRTREGLAKISQVADGIGPRVEDVIRQDASGEAQVTQLVTSAHQFNLEVHPFTLRADALPEYVSSFEEWVHLLLDEAEVDGVFTDFPDQVLQVRKKLIDLRPSNP